MDRNLVQSGGRNSYEDGVLYLGWSGSYAEFDSDSRWLELGLRTDAQPWDGWQPARMAVEADGELLGVRTLREASEKWEILLPETGRLHRVRLTKITEDAFGLAGLEDIRVSGGCFIRPSEKAPKHIEFIGDSITCGYGVEADASDTFSTETENALLGYAVLTAHSFGASFDLVAWSGTGLISRWVPPEADEPNLNLLMPELYGYRDLELHRRLGKTPLRMNPGEQSPDLVVINLGTNDSSWTRGIEEREEEFGKAYGRFLDTVCKMRPGVPVLCTLGILGQQLCPQVRKQAELLQERRKGVKVGYLEFPVQRSEDGMGADGHPSRITQEKAAGILTEKIAEFCGWSAGKTD